MKKPIVFLAAAVVLLGAAAWLMPSTNPGDEAASTTDQAAQHYPSGPTAADQAKLQARKTLPPTAAPDPDPAATAAAAPQAPAAPSSKGGMRDAVMVALPPGATDVLVMEAQTFLQRPIMRGVAQCLAMQGMTFPLESLGLRVADLDRVALVDLGDQGSLAVITGDMGRMDAARLLQNPLEERYGDRGRIYSSAGAPDDEKDKLWTVARFGDGLTLVGKPRTVVVQALDRLEGRAPSTVLIPEAEQYSDAYGRMSTLSLRRVFPADLTDKADAAKLVALFHIDSRKDILIAADAQGEPEASHALGKATAAALAARRAQAAGDGDKAMVKLLDTFRVRLTPDGFKLQAGFTEAYLKQQLGACIEGGRTPAANSGSAGAPAP